MTRELKSDPSGQGLRVGIIAAEFNEFVTTRLLQGARDTLRDQGVRDEDTTVAWVPGSLELPQAALLMAQSGMYDALVVLGTIIRGETSHYDLVAGESTRGVAEVARQTGVPVAFGVLTTENMEQATARAGGVMGNRGRDAALAALKMAKLFRQLAQDDAKSTQRNQVRKAAL
jgi:6,7-dimethyl-8-ribityllumazine synthase